jgi:hypothetical protein
VDITAFIGELLFGHDCVIVPGFGGFIGNYAPARIDRSTGTFYPPVKQISFNRNLDHNDGLLIGRISKFSGVNYGDARTLVDEFVLSVRKKLEKGERVNFENIGSFINNHEGNLQFEPERNINYLLDSYGLEPFQCQPLEGYDARTRIIKHDRPAHGITLRKVLWRAAVIVPVISLLIIARTNLIGTKVEKTTLNPLVTAEFENNKKAVDEGSVIDLSKPEEINAQVKSEVAAPEVTEVVAPPVTKVADLPPVVAVSRPYFVITGSFKSKENAELQAAMLRNEGFSPEVVNAGNGFFRVCAVACNDLETAAGQKDSIAEKFPGSWISRKK